MVAADAATAGGAAPAAVDGPTKSTFLRAARCAGRRREGRVWWGGGGLAGSRSGSRMCRLLLGCGRGRRCPAGWADGVALRSGERLLCRGSQQEGPPPSGAVNTSLSQRWWWTPGLLLL